MTREEAKKVFINKGYVKVKGGIIFDGDKWRQSVEVITEWLKQQPCEDAISRSDAIRVASGYCHWSNIPKELEKLPSVNPKPCGDAISRQSVLDGLASIAKAKAKSDAQKSMMGRTMFFVEQLPSVSTENPNRCEDAISRQAAIGIIQNWLKSDDGYSIGEKNVMKCAINELRDLPSVSTEKTDAYKQGWHDAIETALKEVYIIQQYDDIFRVVQEETLIGVGMAYEQVRTEKTGQWYIDERPESNREIICSNCEQPVFKYHKLDFDYRPKFCPNCGAKMGVEK